MTTINPHLSSPSGNGRAALFSYEGIIGCLVALASRSAIFPLGDWRGQPGIVLRHDIDLDVAPAHRLAEREISAGLRGTFFFLTTAPTYNVNSPSNRALIREMANWGVEVGLHFDPLIYPDLAGPGVEAAARREAAVLENIIGRTVRSVSIHNPSIHGIYPLFDTFVNAYDPRIFSESLYLSDSRMRFRVDPLDFFENASSQTMQLLLHPLHYSNEGAPYPAAMVDYMQRVMMEVDAAFRVNSSYREAVGMSIAPHIATAAKAWAGQGGPA